MRSDNQAESEPESVTIALTVPKSDALRVTRALAQSIGVAYPITITDTKPESKPQPLARRAPRPRRHRKLPDR